MSYLRDLDEIGEDEIIAEIHRRRKARRNGVCDYCGRPPDTPTCKFEGRHHPPVGPSIPDIGDDPNGRLVRWLIGHPLDLEQVVQTLGLPLPRCEGHDHECVGSVLWETPAMTAYEWDDQGEDPNRPRRLCPRCSSDYRSDWQARWDEYRSSVLS